MRLPSVTTLVGNEFDGGEHKFSDFVRGADDCIYGIPFKARRVVKFNPVDKSWKEIGPDFGAGGYKWHRGVLANNGIIYCIPYYSVKFLKIDTVNETVTLLDTELPETGNWMWWSGALAQDGCIYFMPFNARRILKFDPENESAVSVEEDLGDQYNKYEDTVRGNDGCLYGIPSESRCIVRFNPIDQTTSTVGEAFDREFGCRVGVLGRDGFIYAADVKHGGRVLKIDVVNNSYSFVGGILLPHSLCRWGAAGLGNDGCIYWPPTGGIRALKYDPETQEASLVGDDFGGEDSRWIGGAVASDGVIYCMPNGAHQVLAIDPFHEFSKTLEAYMQEYPEELGRLFVKNSHGKTFYESGVTKFGINKVFQAIEECVPLDTGRGDRDLEPFVVAAACENSTTSVIYFFLRRNPDALLVNYHVCDE